MLSKLLRVLALTPKPGLIAAILLLAACRTYTCDVPETCLSTPTALSSLSPTLVVESPSATSTVSTQELTATATPTGSATPFPTRPPAENLILCWGFECNYKLQQNDGDLKVPLGWMAFWGNVPAKLDLAQLQPRNCDTSFKPSVELEQHPTHVIEGTYSARVIQGYRACAAGLFQTIEVKAGYAYIASTMVFNWSTSNPLVDTASTSYVRSFVGLDPTGGTNFAADSVIWSPGESARDHFAYLEVKARPLGSRMTVFLLSIPNFAVARSDSFWDWSALLEIGNPVPTPQGLAAMPTPFATPTPIGPSPGPIIESTPLGGAPKGLGVLVYDVTTNLRDCSSNVVWIAPFDPTTACPLMATDEGGTNVLSPGSITQVWEWRIDRYGNRWAWFGSLAAVACYKGMPRGRFYPGTATGDYVTSMGAGGVLPVAENPCSIGG